MRKLFDNWVIGLRTICVLVIIIWCVELLNSILNHSLNDYGVYPRKLQSLPGILFWPFLHGNLQHLIMNTFPLMVMGFFVATRGVGRFVLVSLFITIIGGLGVWCIGREAYHVGASGLVFGFFGYLVALGIYERSLVPMAVSSFIVFCYGGLIFGVLPGESFVSWEGHLAGLCAGILVARLSFERKLSTANVDN